MIRKQTKMQNHDGVLENGKVEYWNNQDLETLSSALGVETAGTDIKTSIASLAAPSKKGKEAIETLGISAQKETIKFPNRIIEINGNQE